MMLNRDQLLYPKFTALVKGLSTFANTGLKIWTGLTDAQIQSHLQFGKGPIVMIEDLENAYGVFRKTILTS